jgi:regulator of replication initiation timing
MKTNHALIIVAILLLGSILVSTVLYTQLTGLAQSNIALHNQASNLENQLLNFNVQEKKLQEEKEQLKTHVDVLRNQTNELHNLTDSLQKENVSLEEENAELQTQVTQSSAKEPKLVTRLGAKDVRQSPAEGHPWSNQIRFYLEGTVWNVGTTDAENVRLHVTLYQADAVANNTYIELGKIAAGSYAYVASNILYTGEALSNWTIIPELNGQG